MAPSGDGAAGLSPKRSARDEYSDTNERKTMVNKVILVGNVGIDPEVRTLESGAKVARVRLATTERLFDRQANETKEHTEWHTITLWRGLADVVDRYVRKGTQLYIEGRLRTREWTDKDGNKRYTTEILADTMNLTAPLPEGLRMAVRPAALRSAAGSRRRHTAVGRTLPSGADKPDRRLRPPMDSLLPLTGSLPHRRCLPTIRTIFRSDSGSAAFEVVRIPGFGGRGMLRAIVRR